SYRGARASYSSQEPDDQQYDQDSNRCAPSLDRLDRGLSVIASADGLALVDLSPPGSGLRSTILDELLEVLQIFLHLALPQPRRVRGLLLPVLRIELHLKHDAGGVVVEAVEGHDARVSGPAL